VVQVLSCRLLATCRAEKKRQQAGALHTLRDFSRG
jgi:hypothetical protein